MIETPNGFIYELKKALNVRLFSDGSIISNFIDIFNTELSLLFDLNSIKSFSFMDEEYEIKLEIVSNDIGLCESNVNIASSNAVMRFCSLYKSAISTAMNDLSGKQMANAFDLCMEYRDYDTLSQLVFISDFEYNGSFFITLRLF